MLSPSRGFLPPSLDSMHSFSARSLARSYEPRLRFAALIRAQICIQSRFNVLQFGVCVYRWTHSCVQTRRISHAHRRTRNARDLEEFAEYRTRRLEANLDCADIAYIYIGWRNSSVSITSADKYRGPVRKFRNHPS